MSIWDIAATIRQEITPSHNKRGSNMPEKIIHNKNMRPKVNTKETPRPRRFMKPFLVRMYRARIMSSPLLLASSFVTIPKTYSSSS
jgi:hypothetical protein